MLRRVDAENRLQTLKEELDFQKNIYSEVGAVPRAPEGQGWGAAVGRARPPRCQSAGCRRPDPGLRWEARGPTHG